MGRTKDLFIQTRIEEEQLRIKQLKQYQHNKLNNMGASNPERVNIKFYGLKAKVDAQKDPHFALSEKVNDKWQTTATYTQVEGTLVKAEIREKEYDGAKQNVFYITLKDPNEESVIQMTHNQITYSIISSLASGTMPNPAVLIKVWKDQKDSYWNGHASVKVDGEKTQWHVNPKDAPKPEQIMLEGGVPFMENGKPKYNAEKRRKFYEEMFTSRVIPLAQSASPYTIISSSDASKTFIEDMNADNPSEEGGW